MTELKPFQEATSRPSWLHSIDAAARAAFSLLTKSASAKPSLPSMSSSEMISGLDRPLVVFYMCSNLAIARQNRRKLLELLPTDEREQADCPVDRLSLLTASERPTHRRFSSLLPDTGHFDSYSEATAAQRPKEERAPGTCTGRTRLSRIA